MFAFGSQMLALIRDRMLAHTFGAGAELDLYYAAFRIPDLLFVLFASVLSVYVLLPFVSKATRDEDAKAGAHILSQMYTLFVIVYILVAVFVAVIAPYVLPKMFPGFAGEDLNTLVLLTRILLLQPFFLGLSSLAGVVTQLSHRFVLYAISPLIYNLGIIIGVIVFYPWLGLYGLAVGVVIGAGGHLFIQLPFLANNQWRFSLVSNISSQAIIKVMSVALPRALTLSINQILLLVFASFASVMTIGSVSVFQFAYNVQSVPLAIIGMSYSVAAFPVLADLLSRNKLEEFSLHVTTALRHIIFWSVPIVALVIVLRAQIIRVLLGSGSFNWDDTRLTAAVLAIFIISLVAQAAILLLVRAFYAGGRTLVPLLITLIGVSCSVISSWLLWNSYQNIPSFQTSIDSIGRLSEVAGTEVLVLPIGFTIGMLVQFFLMLIVFSKTFSVSMRFLYRQLFQSIAAATVGGITAYVTLAFVVSGINQETFIGIFLQGFIAGLFGLVGIGLSYAAVGSIELREMYKAFHTKIFKTDVIAPQQDVL
ncbi:hypothetical protein KC723_02610 [Candidatus Kaiserbacteria bacterium]|nr:hypothetical protein [Candidatus Kaiserbacteria bacterium]